MIFPFYAIWQKIACLTDYQEKQSFPWPLVKSKPLKIFEKFQTRQLNCTLDFISILHGNVLLAIQRPWEGRKSGWICGQVVEFMSVYGRSRPRYRPQKMCSQPSQTSALKCAKRWLSHIQGSPYRSYVIFVLEYAVLGDSTLLRPECIVVAKVNNCISRKVEAFSYIIVPQSRLRQSINFFVLIVLSAARTPWPNECIPK